MIHPGRLIERDHWPADERRRIDDYRFDARGHLLRVWISGMTLVHGGIALASCRWLAAERVPSLASYAPWLGMLGFALGLAWVLRGLFASLRQEHYASLRTDGIVLCERGNPWFVAWDEIEDVVFEAPRHVMLVLRTGQPLRLDAAPLPVNARALAQRIALVRRRALWGFYDDE